jgi:hypothetical protein
VHDTISYYLAQPRIAALRQQAQRHALARAAVLAGPVDSIIAVRQVPPTARQVGDLDRARAAHHGHRADQGARLRTGAGRWIAEGQRQAP